MATSFLSLIFLINVYKLKIMENIKEQFLEKIKKEVKEIYKDSLDLYLITPDNFDGLYEKVPVICKKCNEITWITPQDLLEEKFECVYCKMIKHYKDVLYRVKRNLDGFDFDLSTIDVNNPDAIYTVRCLRCGKVSRFTLKELSSKYICCDKCSRIKNMKINKYSKIGIEGTVEMTCYECGKKFRPLIKDLSEYMICPECDKTNFLRGRLRTKFDEVFDSNRLTSKDIDIKKNTVRLYSYSNRGFRIYNIDEILSFGKKLISRYDKGIYYNRLNCVYGNDFIVPDIRKDDLLCYEDEIELVCKKCKKVYKESISHLSMRYDKLECECVIRKKEEDNLVILKKDLTDRFKGRFDFSSITVDNFNNKFSDEVDVKCNDCGEVFKVSLNDLLLGSYNYTIHHFCKKYAKDYINFQKERKINYDDISEILVNLITESKAEGLRDDVFVELFTKFRDNILDERLKLLE